MKINEAKVAGPSSSSVLQEVRDDQEQTVALRPPSTLPQTSVDPALAPLAARNRPGASPAGSASASSRSASPAEPSSPAPRARHSARTTASSIAATLASRANSALATGAQQASAAVSKAASNLWSLTDLRTMLQMHADDPAFLRMMRHTDPEQSPRRLACRLRVGVL